MRDKIYNFLSKDVKEYNLKYIFLASFTFLFLVGIISYKAINHTSYALFTDEVVGTKTITLHYEDLEQTKPKITLTKETYIEGFDNWTLNNAEVENNILTLGADGNSATATSDYYNTDGGMWYYTTDVYTDAARPTDGKGGFYTTTEYYDSNKVSVVPYTHSSNGYAGSIDLGSWKSITFNGYSTGNHAEEMSYLLIYLRAGNNYSKTPVKYKNFKLYGNNLPSDFYDIKINTTTTDNIGVMEMKYSKGEEDIDFFRTDGTVVENNQIRVTENGIYTIYVKDNKNRKSISTIQIDKIITNEEQG